MSSPSSARIARRRTRGAATVTALVSAAALAVGASGADAATTAHTASASAAVSLPAGFHAAVLAKGGKLAGPDDITELDGHLFVGYQNGVGPNGEPSSTGNTQSTVVEYTLQGKLIGSWNITGKVDGLGADPERHFVIATSNEDSDSSLYTVKPVGHGKA